MSEPIFYCASLPAVGTSFELPPDEARHATAARRLAVGDELAVFDGEGGRGRARICELPRRGVPRLELLAADRVPPPARRVWLASALPKGDRQAAMLDMATQIGMTDFVPLVSERSVAAAGEGATARWRRIVLEACKQSGRYYLPHLHSPSTPAQLSSRMAARLFLAHPGGEPLRAPALVGDVGVAIGPEGGFTDAEVAALLAGGARKISLGDGILRIETAALAALTLVLAR